ncbi:hypothetical protein, partial [Escherichia coli]|uniref:hypothetical protein n=1 Tax=Escherichia coli TaxID=562 RepID=UPI002576E288
MSRGNHGRRQPDPVSDDDELDPDVRQALHKSQPGPFKGEGKNLGEVVEKWVEAMEEYFDVTGYNERSK